MTAFHHVPLQMLPLNDNMMGYRQANNEQYQKLGAMGGIRATERTEIDIGAVKGDLLADLWLLPSSHDCTSSTSSTPSSSSPSHNNMWKSPALLTPPLMSQGNGNYGYLQGTGVRAIQANSGLRDSIEYKPISSNIAFNDLPALTEENLMHSTNTSAFLYPGRNSSLSDHSDEIFNFEQQHFQQQQQQQQQHQTLLNQQVTQCSSIQQTQQQKNKQLNVNTQLYKTELCASYIKMGICPYGNKCQFAHGENELKSVSRPPKWRSKPCANWSKFGSCRYGNRCCFKHGE
mmetsp:Transcript_2963/g.2884  ORF Transcript_2963/g.2884 Transcript_2963/m.2884 type:complete len:288 (+) Transcript_2963:644-1507(+)